MNQFVAYPPAVDRWDDLISVFDGGDGRGDCGWCRCVWWRLPWRSGGEGLGNGIKALLRQQIEAGRHF
jgi:hypothetical protein